MLLGRSAMREFTSWTFLLLPFYFTLFSISINAADSINRTQSISDGETLISAGESFELGFFTPGSSKNRYLGIWFNKVRPQTVVWVANRDRPLNDSAGGVMKIGGDGNLVLLNNAGDIVWSPVAAASASNPVAQLLDSGNLVVRDGHDNQPDRFLWQSFNEPTDTLLPGMRLGLNIKTGANRSLRAWKSVDDPARGNYSFEMANHELPQLLLLHGSTVKYSTGHWNGIRFSGLPETKAGDKFRVAIESDKDEVYEITWNSTLSRLVLNQSGVIQRLVWNDRTGTWNDLWSAPADDCDMFANCGPYGVCNINGWPNCECPRGFEPKSPQDWSLGDGTGGCVRRTKLQCGNNNDNKDGSADGFLRVAQVKLPDARNSTVNMNMSLDECRDECARDCSCTAYAGADITRGGRGCVTWAGDLVDMRSFTVEMQELYLRVPASELDPTPSKSNRMKNMRVGVAVAVVSAMILLVFCGCCVWIMNKNKKKNKNKNKKKKIIEEGTRKYHQDGSIGGEEPELPLFDFGTIASATNNFSIGNKIGEGGFGIVYKGTLGDGIEVAVKRLSWNSAQGIQEFMNEVMLIAKIQHRNLVRLVGCCAEGEERMLIYEYMQNMSLDSFIFNEAKRALLEWRTRLDIILGIAKGLTYLHHDSRLKIIHRDLKAANILLDGAMNPKISDFGTARVFGADQITENTKRVIGTHGYMSPEYAIDGVFSMKSDVFSFGVLVLEVISGIKNRGIYQNQLHLNLQSYAWRLWQEGNSMKLLDETVATGSSCPATEVLRCIHVGLLCVQEHAIDRPTTCSVVLMLASENFPLPQPKTPGFLISTSPNSAEVSSPTRQASSDTVNEITITNVEGR